MVGRQAMEMVNYGRMAGRWLIMVGRLIMVGKQAMEMVNYGRKVSYGDG